MTLANFDLWGSGFAQMVALWALCLGVVVVLQGSSVADGSDLPEMPVTKKRSVRTD